MSAGLSEAAGAVEQLAAEYSLTAGPEDVEEEVLMVEVLGGADQEIEEAVGYEELANKSMILDARAASRLQRYLPDTASLEGFELAFATYRDGWDISTLFARTETMKPVVLLVRTVKTRAIFGFYLNSPISPPSTDVRGDGLTLIFRLDGPNAACYRWALQRSAVGRDGREVDDFIRHQFAVCSEQMITIGGSQRYATNAIRIDADLNIGHSGPSDTFANPGLVPEEGNTFSISDIEVLCGKSSVAKAMRTERLVHRMEWATERDQKVSDAYVLSRQKSKQGYTSTKPFEVDDVATL